MNEASRPATETFDCDYLVIGAGSAGCAIASRLSESPSVKVVLVEAGLPDRNPLLHVPGAISHNVRNPKYNWNYITEPDPTIGGRSLYFSRGKVLGGSSSINGMVYTRGSKSDYDLWADQYGCIGWSYEDVLPFFKKAERNERGEGKYHGGDGPLQVSKGRPTPPFCDAFLDAAASLGYPTGVDVNAESQEGFAHYDGTVLRGWRQNAATAYLKPARSRKNLHILTDLHADRVLITDRRAIGAEFSNGARKIRISVKAEVIVSCGALNSPILLMRSGIGPAQQLRDIGVQVLCDSPDVGQNLQDHVSYKMHYLCSVPKTAYAYLSPGWAIWSAIQFALFGKGIIGNLALGTGGFFKSSDDVAEADMQVHLSLGLVPDEVERKLPQRDGFTLFVNQGRPFSRGSLRLKADNPNKPVIEARYFEDPRDMEVLVRGVRRAREIMHATPLKPYVSAEMRPGPLAETDESLIESIRQTAVSTYHYMGTCRMGGDEQSVVDPQLRVRGIYNLRVADASIMPAMINGNLNAPSIMVGEKAAHMLRRNSTQ